MTNPSDLMNQYLSLYGVSQESVRGSKQRDLAAASANKRGEIAQITAPEAAFDELAGRQADQGYDSANQTQRDFRDLSPVELEFKYGSQASGLIEARVNAASRLAQSQNNQRTTGELIGDSALAVARGGASMLGLGALGVNLGAKAVGADSAAQIGLEAARFSQSVTDFLNDRQSDTLKGEKTVTEAKIRQANRDSDKRYAEDVKAGDSMAKANQILSEFRNVGKQILENPTVLADSVAEGLGSMGGAGVLAKGVAKVGGAVAARLAPGVQLSEKAAGRLAAANMAGSIGAQEGGSAFQGTTLEAYDILSRDYPDMSEQQKAMLATQAGEMAAATQAPVAAVTGLLVARFEMNPLKAPASAFGVNTIKETLEEGFQGATGTLAQNNALAQAVDRDRDLFEGVGDAAARGMIAGFGTGAVAGAPSATAGAVRGAGKAAVSAASTAAMGAASVTMRGATAAAKKIGETAVFQSIMERAEEIKAREENASPVSAETAKAELNQAADMFQANQEQVIEELRVEGAPEEAIDEVSQLAMAVSFDPVELGEDAPPLVLTAVEGATNRFEAMEALGQVIVQSEENSADQLAAIRYLLDMHAKTEELVKERPMEALDEMPEESSVISMVSAAESALTKLLDNPGIKRGVEVAKAAISLAVEKGSAYLGLDEDPTTPEAQSKIKDAVVAAEYAPTKLDLETSERILEHASQGRIQLTPIQQATLLQSAALVRAERALLEAKEAQGLKTDIDIVAGEAISDLTDAGQKVPRLSLAQHSNRILKAYRAGNIAGAKVYLQDLLQFAEHFQGKVNALNKHFARGGGGKGTGERYPALLPQMEGGKRKWAQSTNTVDVLPVSEGSIRFAQTVAKEAEILAQVANDMTRIFPDLGMSPVTPVTLDPGMVGVPSEVAARNAQSRKQQKAQQTQAVTPSPAPAPTPAAAPVAQPAQTTAEVEQARAKGAVAAASKKQVNPPKDYTPEQRLAWFEGREEARQLAAEEAAQEAAEADIEAPIVEEAPVVEEPVAEPVAEEAPAESQESPEPVSQPAETQEAKIVPDEAPVTAEQVSEIIADALEANNEAQKPEPVVEPVPTVTEVAANPETLKSRFPNLVGHAKGSKITNWFSKAFKLVEDNGVRLWSYEGNPVRSMLDMLTGDVAGYLGRNNSGDRLTPQIVSAYEEFVESNATKLIRSLNRRVDAFLNAPHSKENKTPRKDLFRSGEQAYNEFDTGRILNLTEFEDGKFRLNQELVGFATLAALQWTQQLNNFGSEKNVDDVAALLGIEEAGSNIKQLISGKHREIADAFNTGLTTLEASRSLAGMIKKYWGYAPSKDAPLGYVEGIPEAMAKELIDAMVETGMLNREIAVEKALPGFKAPKQLSAYVYTLPEQDKMLDAVPDLIEQIVMAKPDKPNFVGTPSSNVRAAQHNNPKAKHTRQQKAAIRARQNVPFYANTTMLEFYLGAGDMLRDLFGGGNYDPTAVNSEHEATLKGRNQTMETGFLQIGKLIAQVESVAAAEGKPLTDVPVFFEYAFNSMNRLQMLGGTTPQNNKLMREVFLPTGSTVDISDTGSKAYRGFMLALAQHLGTKIETQPVNLSIQQIQTNLKDKFAGSVEGLSAWLQNGGAVSPSLVQTLKAELGGDLNPGAVHALIEYARYEQMSQESRQSFKTSLYLEADGVTNGPINALNLFTPGSFTSQWVENVRRGGVIFDNAGSMNEAFATNNGDLYKRTSMKLQEIMANTFPNDPETQKALARLKVLLTQFMGKDVQFVELEDGSYELSFDRGITKNPLTVTLYGSGEKGIAEKLTDVLAEKIHERMTALLQAKAASPETSTADAMFPNDPNAESNFEQFKASYEALTGVELKSAKTVSLTGVARDRMVQHMLDLLVLPMQDAIKSTVGPELMDTLTDIRQSTQIQSIAIAYAFRAKVEAAMAAKGNRKSEYLSQAELDQIFESLAPLFPVLQTDAQNFYIPKSNKADDQAANFSQTLTGTMSTPAFTQAPSNSGVRGIPSLVIGSGDGMMMQNHSASSEGPGKTLDVFDGLNLPIDMIEDYSSRINQAVANAWQANPLQGVADAFSGFLPNYELQGKSREEIQEIRTALFGFEATAKSHPVSMIASGLKTLQETLQRKAKEVKARQNALARVSFKVDQMAGAASPYQTQGEISLEGLTTEQIAQELNKLYEEELAKLNGVSVTEAADVSSIKAMAAKLKAEGWQTDILSDQLQSLAEQGYQIVTGSIEQLRAFLNERGVSPNVLDRSGEGRSVNGLTMPDKKLIVLVNPSAETLVHEAIHGATFETVAAYYDGRDLGPRAVEKARAVERIEQLMTQLLGLDVSGETEAAQQAVFDVVSVVDPLLAQGNKAEALNEFMAWGLSNQALAETLSKTKASPLVQLARNVIDGIKRLMFGGKKSPVLDDMFTNLRFNTKILAAPVESPLSLFDDTVLYHSPVYGMSQRLVRLNEALRSTVAVHFQNQMRDQSAGEIQNARNKIAELSAMSGQSVVAANLGFSMNAQESTTYQMLTSVMASAVALDANALSKAADIFTHVSKNLTVADFRQNPDVDDIADATHANEKFNFVMGNYAKEFDALDRSSLLPNFVALALVSEEFRSILAKMPLPADVRNTDGTLDARLENAGMSVMDWLGRKLAGQKSTDRNIAAVMDSLAEQIIKTASERQSFISVVASHVGGAIDTVNATVANFMEATAERGMQLGTKVKNSSNRKTVRVAGEAINAVSGVLNRRVGNENAENLIAETFRADLPKAFTDLVNDLVGRTESNAPIYDLIKRVRSWVTQSRQQYREHLPQKIAEQFSRELSEQEWADMHAGLGKTDLAALRFKYTMADLTEILAQPSRVSAEISKLEGDLKTAHPQDFPTLQRKALQLANYMNTGVPGSTLLRNAAAIADLLGENRSKGYAPTKDTENMLDALVSLYALDTLPQATKDSLAKLAATEASGISFTVEYLAALRKFELRRANGNARFNHFKGYIPNEKKEEATLVVAKDEDYVGLRQQSFKRIANYGGSNLERNMSNRGYYLVPVSTRANYQQGIMQTVQQTVGGVDLMSGLSHDRSAAGVINDANAVRRAWMNRGRESGSELLMPLFDENGNIMAYERSVDPAIMARVQKDNHLGKAIGQWRGRQVEEREGQYVNRMLIERMADMFNKASADEQKNLFVDLFDHRVRKKDPVLEDVYKSLPGHVIQDIVSVFGTQFPVRKDMLNDAMGYRDASVRDLWSSNSRWKPEVVETAKNVIIGTMGMDAYRKLVSAEKLIQNVMTDLRVIIVVKSMFVPAANLTWNVFQLASRGVPLGSIGKGIPRKVAEVNDYLKRREREIDAEAELKAAGADVRKTRTLEAELQSLRDSYKRLSIWPLIEAGEFTSISDGILSQDDLKLSEGRLSEYIEGLADKLPPAARTMARYGLVARDTALFKGLQRTVEYGDFLSKAILYDDLVGRQKKTPEEALAMVTEEFVNYDRLPGRSRGYLEQMGLMWFWHFKIRSTKVALSMVRNNPVHAMLAMSMPVPDMFGAVGSPLTDNMLSVLAEGRAGFSIGPDMALRAPLLHPLASII